MRVRFGYVSHALSLYDCSPSKTLTFTKYKTMDKEERLNKLKELTSINIKNTLRALHYNIAQGIPLYRMSSSMVPLATHPEVEFDYLTIFRNQFIEIGEFVKSHNLRVSFHPNQFTLFTSDKPHITENAIVDMRYHYDVLNTMGIVDKSVINIHVGGAYGNKDLATTRFHENIKKLPAHIKQQMTLENDDKTYNTSETLEICVKEDIPLVFDYHHHLANQCDESIEELLPKIYRTWAQKELLPKIHISSPKSEKEFRSHSDTIQIDFVKPFFEIAKKIGQDIDVMIEAKKKDLALLQLMEELSKLRGYKRISGAVIEI